MNRSPAYRRLTVSGTFGGTESLSHLGLGETEHQPSHLETSGEFTDIFQVDSIHDTRRRLLNRRLAWIVKLD